MVLPNTPTRRRVQARSRLTNKKILRQPILINFSRELIRAGFVGQPTPKFVVEVPSATAAAATTVTGSNTNPDEFYRYYAPFVEQIFDRLGLEAKDRWVLWIFSEGLYSNRSLEAAIPRLLGDMGVSAYSILPAIKMVPFSFPSNSIQTSLIIQLVQKQQQMEAHCIIYSAGQVIESTYQATGHQKATASAAANDTQIPLNDDDLSSFESICKNWLSDDDISGPADCGPLLLALVKCISACPISANRKQAVANMIFAGDVPSPYFGTLVARKLKALLSPTKEETHVSAAALAAETEDVDAISPMQPSPLAVGAVVPVDLTRLTTLAGSVGVIQLKCCRSDLLAWVGASVWGSHWHGRDPEATQFQWKMLVPSSTSSS